MQKYRRLGRLGAVVALGAATALTAGLVLASDHQDTPEVEINPRMDINDVYAFPGASADRITLVMTTSSPIAGTARRSTRTCSTRSRWTSRATRSRIACSSSPSRAPAPRSASSSVVPPCLR